MEIPKSTSGMDRFYSNYLRKMCGEGNSTKDLESCIKNKTFGREDMVKSASMGTTGPDLTDPRLEIKNIVCRNGTPSSFTVSYSAAANYRVVHILIS